ncbi:MAG: hypothetical protein RIT26_2291 [Pseudomonadota bacterium]|jgi:hypothetical protein
MIKILIGFIVFAALALFVIMKGGDSLDMGGEKHGADAVHSEPAKPAAAAATPAAPAAPAAEPAKPAEGK